MTPPSPPPFRAAIFDMDGLLLDSERPVRDAWLQASRELGSPLEEAHYLEVIGRPLADSRPLLEQRLGPACSYDAAFERASALLAATLAERGYAVKAGVVRLLQALHERSVPCSVASSTPRAEVGQRLREAGLAAFFDAFSGGDEVRRGKPAPDLFLLAAERAGQAPRDCLVFEDSEPGTRGAIAAGMGVVVVPDLKPPGADACAASVAVLATLDDALAHIDLWFAGRPAR